jgi:hypothetical protein
MMWVKKKLYKWKPNGCVIDVSHHFISIYNNDKNEGEFVEWTKRRVDEQEKNNKTVDRLNKRLIVQ